MDCKKRQLEKRQLLKFRSSGQPFFGYAVYAKQTVTDVVPLRVDADFDTAPPTPSYVRAPLYTGN